MAADRIKSQRHFYKAYFAKRLGRRNSKDESEALAIAGTYDAMRRRGIPSDEKIKRIIDATAHRRTLVSNCAMDLLGQCLWNWPQLAPTVTQLLNHPSSSTRLAAIKCAPHLPYTIAARMIRAGLTDKSGVVRCAAAMTAVILNKKALVTALTKAEGSERPGKVRDFLDSALRYLRDGYNLTRYPDGDVHIWILNGVFERRCVSEAELKAKGINKLIAEMRNPDSTPASCVLA